MPTSTKTRTSALDDAVQQSRDAFRNAVAVGGSGTDEYRAWVGAYKAADADRTRRLAEAADRDTEQRTAYNALMQESRVLLSLEDSGHVADANVGSTFNGSATYTAEKHQQRVNAWIASANDYATVHGGEPITTVSWGSRLALPIPTTTQVMPLTYSAPRDYSTELNAALAG